MPGSSRKTHKTLQKKRIKKRIPSRSLFFRKKFSFSRGFYEIFRIVLAVFFIIIGVGLLALPSVYPRLASHSSQSLKNTRNKEPIHVAASLLGNKSMQETPIRIVIPSLSIDLQVVEAPVVGGYWQTSDTTASHGEGSAVPGQKGNDVIFAHAREGLFLPLRGIQKDATVYVMTKDHWYRYKISRTKLVDPIDVTVIAPTKDETVTLYTCSGYFDEKRFIATATPF